LYWHEKPSEPTKKGPLLCVLPTSVPKVSRGHPSHPSLVSLVETIYGQLQLEDVGFLDFMFREDNGLCRILGVYGLRVEYLHRKYA
jgi:hypothetical protein